MNQTEAIGMNRTGIQMSPIDSRAMQTYEGALPEARFDDSAGAELRSDYIMHSEGLGSVPLPGTVKGAVKTGVAMLKGDQPTVLLDKLAERLAFERTGTRLYDALLTKCEAKLDDSISMTMDDVREIRDDEARHFIMVAQAIETLGGDPTCQTPSADLAGVESMGLVQVLNDPRTSIAQCLHALLTAELADQAGWEALIALAEDQDQLDMVNDFSVALDEERGHLLRVQSWYEESIGIVNPGDIDDNAVLDEPLNP